MVRSLAVRALEGLEAAGEERGILKDIQRGTRDGEKEEPVTTSNNSDFTVVIVTVGSASGSLKAEPKECLTGKGQVLSKGLRA